MDRARIEEEFNKKFGPIKGSGYLMNLTALSATEFASHIAAIARAEALEDAAEMINNLPLVNDSVAEKIRALKDTNNG